MAIELERFIKEQLTQLPRNHPDRAYLRGVLQTTEDYHRTAIISRSPQEPPRPPIDYNPLTRRIEILGLQARVKNALLRDGIKSIDQLVATRLIFKDDFAGMVRQVGDKSVQEIENRLDAFLEKARVDSPEELNSSIENIERFLSLAKQLSYPDPEYPDPELILYDIIRAGVTTIRQFNSLSDDELEKRLSWHLPKDNVALHKQEVIRELRALIG